MIGVFSLNAETEICKLLTALAALTFSFWSESVTQSAIKRERGMTKVKLCFHSGVGRV